MSELSALRELVESYALHADRRDAAAFCSLWTPDARLVVYQSDGAPQSTYEGADAMAGVVEALRSRYASTLHMVGAHGCAVDGDQATGEVSCVAHHVTEAGVEMVMAIRYVDRYRRDAGEGWRFEHRECHKLWTRTGNVDVHREP